MAINPKQLLIEVIRPALNSMDKGGVAAEQLVLGTAAQESACGTYLRQRGGGPALGIFQMEPNTHDDIVAWVRQRPRELALAQLVVDGSFHVERLVYDLRYATVLCRLHYWRRPEPLPAPDDWPAMAKYWKRFYNTARGAGTEERFLSATLRHKIREITNEARQKPA